MKSIKPQGFTLIEVLLASVILFTVLAVMTAVFRQSVLTSQKAEQRVAASSQLAFIIDDIADVIRGSEGQPEAKGSGSLLGVEYRFEAVPSWRRHPVEQPDPITGQMVVPERWFTLWDVTLVLQYQQREQQYQYQELSWSAP